MTRADDLIRILRSGESARPRLVWYAPGERIELSGRVLATWASKAADLLQEDLDVVGTRVGLTGAPHWRLLAWALATWAVGGTVVLAAPGSEGEDAATGSIGSPADGAPVDVLVVDGDRLGQAWRPGDPTTWGAGQVVALTRAALARRSPVALPAGVIDDAAELLSHADEMDPYDTASDGDAALLADGPAWAYADVVPAAGDERRHLSGSAPLGELLRQAAGVWAAGGSIVLTDPAWEAEQGGDPATGAFAQVLESEGVSAPQP